jgi:hypothetical protein
MTFGIANSSSIVFRVVLAETWSNMSNPAVGNAANRQGKVVHLRAFLECNYMFGKLATQLLHFRLNHT